jgi:hypothetical protein
MDFFSFLSFHFMCVTVMVVTGHSVALNRRSHLFSTMSSLHDVLVHDNNIVVFDDGIMYGFCCVQKYTVSIPNYLSVSTKVFVPN